MIRRRPRLSSSVDNDQPHQPLTAFFTLMAQDSFFMFPSPFPRRRRLFAARPQSAFFPLRRSLERVQAAVGRVPIIDPSVAASDLLGAGIHAVAGHPRQRAPVVVFTGAPKRGVLSEAHCRQRRFCCLAEGLTHFRRVDLGQAHTLLMFFVATNSERVAVGDTDDFTGFAVGEGANEEKGKGKQAGHDCFHGLGYVMYRKRHFLYMSEALYIEKGEFITLQRGTKTLPQRLSMIPQ